MTARAKIVPWAGLAAIVLSEVGCGSWGAGSTKRWHMATSPHFVVRGDFDEATAIATAIEVERTRDELISVAWPTFPFPETARTEVFVLSSSIDFGRLFGWSIAGTFQREPRPAFFITGSPAQWNTDDGGSRPTGVLRHEIAHQLARAVSPPTAVVFGGARRVFGNGAPLARRQGRRGGRDQSVRLGELGGTAA